MSRPGHGTAKAISGITVSPALQSITVDQDQPSKSFDFSVTNNDPVEQELHLSTVDFGSLDDTGGVLFLGPEKALNYKYGLAHWISLEKDSLILEPHETQKVVITIDNQASLTPGGHYGAVLVTPVIEQAAKKQQTLVNQVASSLLFLTKEGGAHYSLKLAHYSLNGQLARMPSTLSLRFQNDSNVHVIPRGLVTVTDPLGRAVKKGIINSDSGLAMPESFREINAPLVCLSSAFVPGFYQARISYYYEGQPGAPHSFEKTFLYINGWYLIALGMILAATLYFRLKPRQWTRLCGVLGRRPVRKSTKDPSA
jgi:hypothetical protein